MGAMDESGGPASFSPPTPTHALYVLRQDATGDGAPESDATHLVTDVREVDWRPDTRVATSPGGRFVGVADAIEHDAGAREALLGLSPDPALDRWKRLRALALAAPVSWGFYVVNDARQVDELSKDAHQLLDSPAFKQAELDAQTAASAKARRTKIERAITMRWTYAAIEGAIGLAALIVVIAGWRRFRTIAVAVGAGAGLFWLFHAGQPGRCFGASAYRELFLALLGVFGAVAAFVLAPSETKIVRGLRKRLGIEPVVARDGRLTTADRDLLATLAAAWAGISLPFLLTWLGKAGVADITRAAFFVGFCLFAFLGFLAWRREESRVAPKLAALAVAAALGFGVTTACDVAARASLATVIEAQTCVAPESAKKLKNVQESSAKETTAARKETQTQALAFWIAVLAAPLAEEMLYRGTLQRVARRRLGARGAMALSAAVFGVAHALAFPAAFYQHFGLGLAFAAAFELAGAGAVGVVASAATHAAWNLWLASMPVF